MTLPNIDETTLTAYALGELAEPQRGEVEAMLRDSAFARNYVERVRATGRKLAEEFAGETASGLTAIQHAALEQRILRAARREPAVVRTHRRWNRAVLAGCIAASVLIVGGVAALILPPLYRQFETPPEQRRAIVAHLPYIITDGTPSIASVPGDDSLPMTRPAGPHLDPADENGTWTGVAQRPLAKNPIEVQTENPLLGALHAPEPGVPLTSVRLINGIPHRWNDGTTASPAPADPSANGPSAYVRAATTLPTPAPIDASLPPVDADAYDRFVDHVFLAAADHPLSSFAPEVGFASFRNIRRSLTHGQLPPPDAVRAEELLNYFSWRTLSPSGSDGMSGDVELSACPWNAQHQLARIVLQARPIAPEIRPPVNLVFVVDVSASMSSYDKLPLIQRGLKLLLSQLGSRDRIAIVATPQAGGLLLPPTPGDRHQDILDAVNRLHIGVKSAGTVSLESAYYSAASSFISAGINSVVFLTDGQSPTYSSRPDSLTRIIREGSGVGISLAIIAVAPNHLDDPTLRHLGSAGRGTIAVVDHATDARKAFFNLANASQIQAAGDVRIEVKINPVAVQSYRVIGYESHVLRDSADDEHNAGEMGAGRAVTALYELVPAIGADGSALAVRVRYRRPGSDADQSLALSAPLRPTPLSKASNDFYFASSVAEFAMLLRVSNNAGSASFTSAIDLAQRGRGADQDNSRAEFVDLVRRANLIAAH